jgi:hypothetical protein
MLLDLRLAVRRLRLSPGLATLAPIILPRGIGATTTVFTLLNTVFGGARSLQEQVNALDAESAGAPTPIPSLH